MSVNPENTGRIQDGRFRAGVSGNPNGRPKVARNHATRLADALLEDDAVALGAASDRPRENRGRHRAASVPRTPYSAPR